MTGFPHYANLARSHRRIIGNSNPLLIAAAEATATTRNWQLQNSSPTTTIDQENKTHQKKKQNNKKTKVRAVPGNRPDRQTDRPVDLIYKMKSPTNKSLLSFNGPTCMLLLLCKLSKQMKNEKLTK